MNGYAILMEQKFRLISNCKIDIKNILDSLYQIDIFHYQNISSNSFKISKKELKIIGSYELIDKTNTICNDKNCNLIYKVIHYLLHIM